MGGTAVSGSALFATSAAAEPDVEKFSSSELEQAIPTVLAKDDVSNVMGSEWVRGAYRSTVTQRTQDGATLSEITIDGETAVVNGASVTLTDGNEMTTMAFVSSDRALAVYDYDDAVDGVLSEAKLWRIEGEGDLEEMNLRAEDRSINGTHTTTSVGTADLDCDPCHPLSGGEEVDDVSDCVDIDLACAAGGCGACATSCICCVPGCIACLLTACPTIIVGCCEEWDTSAACVICSGKKS